MHDLPDTQSLASAPLVTAPDGSQVRPLCRITGLGSFGHFQLEPGETARAVSHATVQEIWYIVGGRGLMWRQQDGLITNDRVMRNVLGSASRRSKP